VKKTIFPLTGKVLPEGEEIPLVLPIVTLGAVLFSPRKGLFSKTALMEMISRTAPRSLLVTKELPPQAIHP